MLRYQYFDLDHPARMVIRLFEGDDLRGSIFVRKESDLPEDPHPHTPCWQVSGIDVVERFRRQGYGTKLYEEAALQAQRHGAALCSDTVGAMSDAALAFWEKQVKRGRAYWEVPGPAEREGFNYDYGRFVLKFPVAPSLGATSGREKKMPTTDDRFEYIVHFVAPFRDPRLSEVQLEDNLYLVKMTQDQADAIAATLKRLFDAGFIVHGFSVAPAEATRVSPMNLRERLTYYKQQGMK